MWNGRLCRYRNIIKEFLMDRIWLGNEVRSYVKLDGRSKVVFGEN